MPVSSMHPDTVVVRRTVATNDTDDHGLPIVEVTEQTIEGVAVEPLAAGAASDALDDGEAIEVFRVSTSVVADWVSENDTCTWNGQQFVVNRPPRTYRRYKPHTEFNLIEARG